MNPGKQQRILGLSPNVFFLGLVSFFNDISSEMIFNVLPLFLANVLGVRTSIIGLIEGIAESASTLLKIPSGWLSDRLRRRKAITTFGYALSALAKPLLYLATAWGLVLVVRFADRVGKGIRTSPRDALIADSSPPREMGKSFGFHRAMDTMGAVLGIAIAAGAVFYLQRASPALGRSTFQTLVLMSIVPAFIAVLLLFLAVREPKSHPPAGETGRNPGSSPQGDVSLPSVRDSAGKDRAFKTFLVVVSFFNLGNFSNAFLVLRAQSLGFSVLHILLILGGFNVIYSLVSLPAGRLSDRVGRKALILGGWLVFALVYLGFAVASAPWHLIALFALYGVYYGATEGVARAFVADMVGSERRGTAYGLFYAAAGVVAFFSSVIAGWLWQAFNPSAPFLFGAAMAIFAAALLALLVREPRSMAL